MRVGSLFSGIGGFDLAFERAGAAAAFQVEIDAHCQRVLTAHFPKVTRYDDVSRVHGESVCLARSERRQYAGARGRSGDGAEGSARRVVDADGDDERTDEGCPDCIPAVDVLCGGFPCQDLSVAGKRAGLAGDRSGLWHEFRRLIAEVAPAWVLIENVPGLLSSNGGRDFAVILSGLVELGYGVAWRVLDAQHFGVPQRRRRVFIVGRLGDTGAAACSVLFESESVRGDSAPRREARKEVAGTLGGGAGERGWSPDTDRMTFVPELARTPVSSGGNDKHDTTRMTYVAHALNAERDGYNDGSDQTYVPVAPTINAGGNRTVDTAESLIAFTDVAKSSWKESDGTWLAAHAAKDAHTLFVIQPASGQGADLTARQTDVATPIDADEMSPPIRVGSGVGIPSGPAIAVNIMPESGQGADLIAAETDVAMSLSSKNADNPGYDRGTRVVGASVRRLTPTECERLQGFPDGWTAGQADSTRYRQLGNAVAVPVVEWIARRLVATEA